MKTCFTDECQKSEWNKLRQLRLLQVREQSKKISKDVLEKTKQNYEEQKRLRRTAQEAVFEDYKKFKIKELEAEYARAMEMVGLATREAQKMPIPDEVLHTRMLHNREIAMTRGKIAESNESKRRFEQHEKENSLVRRKFMTREIEDIRAGLVVQSRDWTVLNQARSRALLDIPLNTTDRVGENNSRRSPAKSLSAREQNFKSPRSGRFRPYPSAASTVPSSVPPFSEKLESLPSSSRQPTTSSECVMAAASRDDRYSRSNPDRLADDMTARTVGFRSSPPPVTSGEQQPRQNVNDWATHRISSRHPQILDPVLPRRMEAETEDSVGGPEVRSNAAAVFMPPAHVDDDELARLLRRYEPGLALSPLRVNKHCPCPSPRKRLVRTQLEFTSPTRKEKNNTSINARKSPPRAKKSKNVSNMSETKKLFSVIDKALEEKKPMRKDSSSPKSVSSSSGESDEDAVVQMIVVVNCGHDNVNQAECNKEDCHNVACKSSHQVESARTKDTALNIENNASQDSRRLVNKKVASKIVGTESVKQRTVATEVGDSLIGKNNQVDTPTSRSCSSQSNPVATSKCSEACCRANDCSGTPELLAQRQCYFHYVPEPLQRSSTMQDLNEEQDMKLDISSIQQDADEIVYWSDTEKIVRGNQPAACPSDSTSYLDFTDGRSSKGEDKSNKGSEHTAKSNEMLRSDLAEGKEEKPFKPKPLLEYFIRKLLDQPAGGAANQEKCDRCDCPRSGGSSLRLLHQRGEAARSRPAFSKETKASQDKTDSAAQPRQINKNVKDRPRQSQFTKNQEARRPCRIAQHGAIESTSQSQVKAQHKSHPRTLVSDRPRRQASIAVGENIPPQSTRNKPCTRKLPIDTQSERRNFPIPKKRITTLTNLPRILSTSGVVEENNLTETALPTLRTFNDRLMTLNLDTRPVGTELANSVSTKINERTDDRLEVILPVPSSSQIGTVESQLGPGPMKGLEWNSHPEIQQEAYQRTLQISRLRQELVEIRRVQEQLHSSSSSSLSTSGKSSTDGSAKEEVKTGNIMDVRQPPQPQRTIPLPETLRQIEKPSREARPGNLSTIVEVDSQIQASKTEQFVSDSDSDTSEFDKMEYLLRRNIIRRPFKWARSHTSDENDDANELQLSLTLPSLHETGDLLLPASSHHDQSSELDGRQDLSQALSRLDLSWAKRL